MKGVDDVLLRFIAQNFFYRPAVTLKLFCISLFQHFPAAYTVRLIVDDGGRSVLNADTIYNALYHHLFPKIRAVGRDFTGGQAGDEGKLPVQLVAGENKPRRLGAKEFVNGA